MAPGQDQQVGMQTILTLVLPKVTLEKYLLLNINFEEPF